MADTRAAMLRLSALVGERTLFENDGYRKLWLARLLAHTPSNALAYTMLILVVDATGRAFFSSLFVVAYIAPSAVLGTFSGVMVDALPKGVLLAGTSAIRAGLCLLLAISTDSLITIYGVAALFAINSQFSGPAEAAAMPAVVSAEDLPGANSLNNLGGLIAQIVGLMVLPAVFLKTVGPEALAVVCGGLFLASAFNFLLIEGLGGRVERVNVSIEDARERFAEAWQRLTLDSISYVSVVIIVLASTTALVVATLLPRYSQEVLDIGTENAIFVVTPAVAGIWLALRLVRQSKRMSPWWGIGGPYGLLVVGLMVASFVGPLADGLESLNPGGAFEPGPLDTVAARIIITSVVGATLAFAFTFVSVVGRSIVNERMPHEMQGRVFAAQTVLTNLASIPPILLAGILADIIGVPPVFFIVAVVCGLLAVWYAARNAAMPARSAY